MRIRLDLHVHSKVSKSIPFDLHAFVRTSRRAAQVGLDGFAVTEHVHAFDYWRAMGALAARFDHDKGLLRVGPRRFPVLTGMELSVSVGGERADTIVIGPLERLWALDRAFSPTLNNGYHPTLNEVIPQVRKIGLIIIGAHPFRPGKMLAQVGEEGLAQLDALEVNGKDMAMWNADGEVVPLARKLGVAVVGSSDAHLWPQIGVQRTIVPMKELSFEGLHKAIKERATGFESHPNCRTLVHISKQHKTLIKARVAAAAAAAAFAERESAVASARPRALVRERSRLRKTYTR